MLYIICCYEPIIYTDIHNVYNVSRHNVYNVSMGSIHTCMPIYIYIYIYIYQDYIFIRTIYKHIYTIVCNRCVCTDLYTYVGPPMLCLFNYTMHWVCNVLVSAFAHVYRLLACPKTPTSRYSLCCSGFPPYYMNWYTLPLVNVVALPHATGISDIPSCIEQLRIYIVRSHEHWTFDVHVMNGLAWYCSL